jgi:RNA polymerase sigma-54 factor
LLVEQSEFFLKGPKYLKPLTQRDVADKIGVHETTVSRIATAKWIDTDWGILPLKQLFSNAVGDGGQSKNSVKELVKEIILSNSSGKALSDQKISDLLLEKGVKVARRTVAKYRGELNIDSSFVRGPGEN